MSMEDLKKDLSEGNSRNKTRQTTVREQLNDMIPKSYEKFVNGEKKKTFIMSGDHNDSQ